jgi:uncharacterized membrane protein (DUF485 family)
MPDTRKKAHRERADIFQMLTRMYGLNILLTFALVVSFATWLLATERSHVNISLAVTLISAVTAIVTSWLLSIGKRLFRR